MRICIFVMLNIVPTAKLLPYLYSWKVIRQRSLYSDKVYCLRYNFLYYNLFSVSHSTVVYNNESILYTCVGVCVCARSHVCLLTPHGNQNSRYNDSRDSLILSFSITYIHSSNFPWNTRFILELRDFVQTEFDVVTPTNIFWLSKWC